MTSSELKLKAKELLMGKKKNAAVALLIMMLILGVVDAILGAIFPGKSVNQDMLGVAYTTKVDSPITSIVSFAVSLFLSLGLSSYFMKIARGEEPEFKELFSQRNILLKACVTSILTTILLALGYVALIVPGVILTLMYSMITYIYIDNPEIGIIEVMKKSREMMKGHKTQYFCLVFSFFGWIILCGFTLGLLLFWLVPYMSVTTVLFYDSIKGTSNE